MYSHRQSECSRIAAGNTGVTVRLTVDQPRQNDYYSGNELFAVKEPKFADLKINFYE